MEKTPQSEERMAAASVLSPLSQPKRRYSEKRKQQNRAAQKTYREKRKQRLARAQELEALASAAGILPTSASETQVSSSTSGHAGTSERSDDTSVDPDQNKAHHSATPIAESFSPGSASWWMDPMDVMANLTLPALEPTIFDLDQATSTLLDTTSFTAMPDSIGSWQLTSAHPTFPAARPKEGSVDVQWIRKVLSNYTPKDGHTSRPVRALSPPSPRWDPHSNNITLTTHNFITASLANCVYLGISPSTFCADDATSPFFRAAASPLPPRQARLLASESASAAAELTDALVARTQASFASLKPDLRPTRAQVLVRHEPWIDVLPFPGLRDALIGAVAAALAAPGPVAPAQAPAEGGGEERCDFDTQIEAEFWTDVVCGEALVCWGGVRGAEDGSGAPWDARSWEARGWFLEKWAALLGEGGGELGRASRWWRSARGEDLPD